MRGTTVFLLLAIIVHIQADTVVFNYPFLNSPTQVQTWQWTDTGSWQNGVVPTESDDVVVMGGYSSDGYLQTIQMPSSPVSVHSLTVDALDVAIALAATFTVANFSIGSCIFTAPSMETLVVTHALTVTNYGGAMSFTKITLNISASATADFADTSTNNAMTMNNVVINNMGTWTTTTPDADAFMGDNTNGLMTFNNYNDMIITSSSDAYDPTASFSGTLNNYGTITVDSPTTFQLGPDFAQKITTFFNNHGTVQVNGVLRVYSYTNATFNAGGTLSGDGTIQVYGECDYTYPPFLILMYDLSFPSISLIGCATIATDHKLTVSDTMNWVGGTVSTLTPAGATTASVSVYNLTHVGDGDHINPAVDPLTSLLYGLNFTVTNFWYNNFPAPWYIGNNAFFIQAKGSTTYLFDGTHFAPYPNDLASSKVGVVDYSYTYVAQYVFSYQDYLVPLYHYGTLAYSIDWTGTPGLTGTGEPCGWNTEAGAVFGGNYTFVESTIGSYYADSSTWVPEAMQGPYDILPSATFNGGLLAFQGFHCDDGDWSSPQCWKQNMAHWRGRPAGTTIGHGIILMSTFAIFSIDGPNVVFERFWVEAGQLTGEYNLTVMEGTFSPEPDYPDPQFAINGTMMIIPDKGSFNWTYTIVSLYQNGGLVVEQGGTLYIFEGFSDEGDGTGVFYNYGTFWNVNGEQDMDNLISVTWYNYGSWYINSIVTDTSSPRGDQNDISALFYNYGTVYAKIYSTTEMDTFNFIAYGLQGPLPCVWSGSWSVHFQYSPKAGDQLPMFTALQPACTGLLNVTSDNLPSGLALRILYDQVDGVTTSTYHFIVVCSTSNATCMSLSRDPKYEFTATSTGASSTSKSTTSGTGSQTSTTHASTSSSPSSTSSSPSSSTSPSSSSTSTTNANNNSASSKPLPILLIISTFFLALVCF